MTIKSNEINAMYSTGAVPGVGLASNLSLVFMTAAKQVFSDQVKKVTVEEI